jgi:hypothetical protein
MLRQGIHVIKKQKMLDAVVPEFNDITHCRSQESDSFECSWKNKKEWKDTV